MTPKATIWKITVRKWTVPAAVALAMGAGACGAQARAQKNYTTVTPSTSSTSTTTTTSTTITPMQQHRADMIIGILTQAGFTDTTVQDAIVAFALAQDTARQALRDQARALVQAALDPTTTDDTLSTQLAAFQAAVTAEEARTTTALADLDTAVGYSTQPRLAVLLTTLGLLGDASLYAGGPGDHGGPGGPGDHGGPGGGRR